MTNKTLPLFSIIFLSILWGTVYPVIKIGVSDVPPFLYNTIRQFIAGVLLVVMGGFATKWRVPEWNEIKKQILPAFLMISIGQGFVGWALLFVPSGLTALLISITPVYVLIIEMILSRRLHFSRKTILGLLFGVIGMAIVFRENLADLFDGNYLMGVLLTLVAGFCWAGASIYVKSRASKLNRFYMTGIQLTLGSFGLLIFTLALGELDKFSGFTTNAVFSLVYMIVLGSVVGFVVYFYALSKLQVLQVSVVTYINPLIAAIIGWWFLGEALSIYLVLAFAVTMVGVYLVNVGSRV